MLVITRRAGESILIGDDIELQIIELTPSRVKLGIAAPRSLSILRKEIRVAAAENRAASQTSTQSEGLQNLLTRLREK